MANSIKLPYLHIFKRHGKAYAYYRRGRHRVRIAHDVGSPAFLERYKDIHASFERPARAEPGAGSFAALAREFLASPDFRGLAPSSRRDYGHIIEKLATRFGPLPVATMPRALVFKLRDELADKPRMANYTIAVLRRLMSFAVDRGYRPDNPVLRPRMLKTSGGHRPWGADEIERFRARWQPSTVQRVAFELALFTGQRGGDLIRLTRHDYRDGWISLRQSKTGQPVDIPAAPPLRAVLDPWLAATGAVVILVTDTGRAFTADNFRHVMRKAYEAAGLPADCTTHGLRHTTATILAEQGCDWPTIAAVTGHRTAEMVRRYTSRLRLSRAAVERLKT